LEFGLSQWLDGWSSFAREFESTGWREAKHLHLNIHFIFTTSSSLANFKSSWVKFLWDRKVPTSKRQKLVNKETQPTNFDFLPYLQHSPPPTQNFSSTFIFQLSYCQSHPTSIPQTNLLPQTFESYSPPALFSDIPSNILLTRLSVPTYKMSAPQVFAGAGGSGENQQDLAYYAQLWDGLAIQIHNLNEAKVVAMTGAFFNALDHAGRRYMQDRMRYDSIERFLGSESFANHSEGLSRNHSTRFSSVMACTPTAGFWVTTTTSSQFRDQQFTFSMACRL
jgi:hypothetical protein